MLDFSSPITPGALIQTVAALITGVATVMAFFYGLRSNQRLTDFRMIGVEGTLGKLVEEQKKTSETLGTLAVQTVQIQALQKDVEELRRQARG